MNNGSCSSWVDHVEDHEDSVAGIIYLIICILTILAELVLFGLILSEKDLRRQRVNMFMISIGCSDVAFCLYLLVFNQPGINKGRFEPIVNSSVLSCKLWNIFATFLTSAPWYNFLGLMLERLWAIKRPFHFNVSLKQHRLSRLILVCWALAVLPTVPLWFDTTIAANWEGKDNCKCFMPLNNKVWMIWVSITNYLVPASLILLIWVTMAHHFATHPSNNPSNNLLRGVTLKMVAITALFLLFISPFCFEFISAAVIIPSSTRKLDFTLALTLVNALIQPIIYISAFSRLREAFVKIICCQKPGFGTAMVMAVFQTNMQASNIIQSSIQQSSDSSQIQSSDQSSSVPSLPESVIQPKKSDSETGPAGQSSLTFKNADNFGRST